MAKRDYRPGDVISRRFSTGVRRYVVQDPPRTLHGKLRLLREGHTYVQTTWWGYPDNGYRLPKGYELER